MTRADTLAPPIRVHPVRQGLDAARANLAPGAVLWAVGIAILAGYYLFEPTRGALDMLARLKEQWGYLFSAVSTGLVGGLIPVLIQQVMPNLAERASPRHLPFFVLFWAYKGVETDALYRLQAWMFGDKATLSAMAPKVAVDMLIFVPLWAVPSLVVAYLWKDCGFDFAETRRRLGPQWYRRRVVPVMISNWAVWFPAVCVIYALPLALQLPIQNVVLCLWVLMLMFLTSRRG
jgi:hypothetical protein